MPWIEKLRRIFKGVSCSRVIPAKAGIGIGFVMVRHYYVYIMANNRPTLYVGITNSIERRSVEHKYKLIDGFTEKYNLSKLHFLLQMTKQD